MKFINSKNKLVLIIKDDLLKKIQELAINKYPNEFGGFLIGQYINNFKTVEIISIILPIKYKGTPTSFVRLTNDMQDVFNEIFTDTEQYYIGEWHTHPDGSTMYSQTDLNAMWEIVNSDSVNIKNPILLILSINEKNVSEFTFYYYDNNNLIPYE